MVWQLSSRDEDDGCSGDVWGVLLGRSKRKAKRNNSPFFPPFIPLADTDSLPPLQYRDDTQEIDMEFLSRQFHPSPSSPAPVNLVLQSPDSVAAGFSAANTSSFAVHPLPFAPDQGYHEYRFDWLPGKVSFYADGKWLQDMTTNAPDRPGHLILNHWSNGDAAWSGGPPAQDAALTVSYVKAYFNSSDGERQAQHGAACVDEKARERVCMIPELEGAPEVSGPDGNVTGRTYFFSLVDGQTVNQTVYNTTGPPRKSEGVAAAPAEVQFVFLLTVMLACALL